MARFRIDFLIVALLIALAVVCYWPISGHTYVEFDDTEYVVANPHVRNGLSWSAIQWAFSTSHMANWHPLTWLSHMLDSTLFGMNIGMHHVTSLVFHAANGVLLYLALRALLAVGQARSAASDPAPQRGRGRGKQSPSSTAGQTAWCCGLIAALFVVHPQHVESVAWLSERKDLLSAFFWMLTLIAYAWYAAGPQTRGRYLVVVLGLALGLMSKPMVVTLPAVLLLLDFWPLGRWTIDRPKTWKQWLPPWPLVREKLPLVGVIVISSVVTFFTQRAAGAVVSATGLSLWSRFANALWSYVAYLGQTVWPTNFAFFYPHPTAYGEAMRLDYTLFCAIALIAVTVAALALYRAAPFVIVGWLWYLGTLVPVIGIVQVGDQARADRYTYIPTIGAYIVIVFGAALLWNRLRSRASQTAAVAVAGAVSAVLIGVLCVLTFRQQATWSDSQALALQGLKATGDGNHNCHYMLGVVHARRGQMEEALRCYRKSLELNPNSPMTLHNMSLALLETNQAAEAEPLLRKLIEARPDLVSSKLLLVESLRQQRKNAVAMEYLERLTKDPDAALEAYAGLAVFLSESGQQEQALKRLDEADKLYGRQTELRLARGNVLRDMNRLDEAAALFEAEMQGAHDPVKVMALLADVRIKQGRIDDAIALHRQMLANNPGNQRTQLVLATMLDQVGRSSEAVAELRDLLTRYPQHADAANNLAWILATHDDPRIRDGKEALRLAEAICAPPNPASPAFLDTLAAAYAEVGRFPDAAQTARQAIKLAHDARQTDMARDIQTRLKLYEAGRPYRREKPAGVAQAPA